MVQSSKVGLHGCLCICVTDYCKRAFKVFIYAVGLGCLLILSGYIPTEDKQEIVPNQIISIFIVQDYY